MFFLMLINLGLGSMIGTMSGITTPIIDTFKVRKEVFTGEVFSPATSWGMGGGSLLPWEVTSEELDMYWALLMEGMDLVVEAVVPLGVLC